VVGEDVGDGVEFEACDRGDGLRLAALAGEVKERLVGGGEHRELPRAPISD
jgi:hypothetical protein